MNPISAVSVATQSHDFMTIDWRAVLAVGLVIALGMMMVAIKTRCHSQNAHKWVFYCGVALGLLGSAMAIYYGIYKGDSIISVLSALAIVAMAVFRIVGMETIVAQFKQGYILPAMLGFGMVILCWFFVYIAGSFEGQADGAAKSEIAALSSPQVLAIDARIAAATAQLNSLSNFANGTAAAQSSRATRDLEVRLEAAQSRLKACNPLIVTKCVNPRTADVQAIERQIDAAKGYATGNGDYLTASALLADLQSQKSKLISSGGLTTGKVGKDVAFMAWALGTTDTGHASRVLWLLYVGFIDVLSLGVHLFAAIIRPSDDAGEHAIHVDVSRLKHLRTAGFSADEAHHLLSQKSAMAIGSPSNYQPTNGQPTHAVAQPIVTSAKQPIEQPFQPLARGETPYPIGDSAQVAKPAFVGFVDTNSMPAQSTKTATPPLVETPKKVATFGDDVYDALVEGLKNGTVKPSATSKASNGQIPVFVFLARRCSGKGESSPTQGEITRMANLLLRQVAISGLIYANPNPGIGKPAYFLNQA
ncbi:MAG: hypothetical protein PHF58_10590 [Methylotenera sp.]|nr:hypothetical protein [Methylotenera sp.]